MRERGSIANGRSAAVSAVVLPAAVTAEYNQR